jgi:hypothetical protein
MISWITLSACRAWVSLSLGMAGVADLDLLAAFAHRDAVRVVTDHIGDLAAERGRQRPVEAGGGQQGRPEFDALGQRDVVVHLHLHPGDRAAAQQPYRPDVQVVVEDVRDGGQQPLVVGVGFVPVGEDAHHVVVVGPGDGLPVLLVLQPERVQDIRGHRVVARPGQQLGDVRVARAGLADANLAGLGVPAEQAAPDVLDRVYLQLSSVSAECGRALVTGM